MRRDVFQAIADPTRRDIISLLARQAMTPNTVADRFSMSRQAVSKHIRILAECGILTRSIRGREYYYSIQPRKLAEVSDWLEPFRNLWESRFSQLDDTLEKLKTTKHGNQQQNKGPKGSKKQTD